MWSNTGSTAVARPSCDGYITVQTNVAGHRCKSVSKEPICIVDRGATFAGGWRVCLGCIYFSLSCVALHSTSDDSSRQCMSTKMVVACIHCCWEMSGTVVNLICQKFENFVHSVVTTTELSPPSWWLATTKPTLPTGSVLQCSRWSFWALFPENCPHFHI